MTPTRNEAAERLRNALRLKEQSEGGSGFLYLLALDAALAAEREPLLAALRALVEAWDGRHLSRFTPEYRQARALIEQDGRTEK